MAAGEAEASGPERSEGETGDPDPDLLEETMPDLSLCLCLEGQPAYL